MSTHTAEAIVIGGGVMGLASARELARRGHTVTLLERARPGRAASWASAGIIGATSRAESDPSANLRRVSNALWPAFAEAVQAESGMDPEYRQMGCLHLASSEAELEGLYFLTGHGPSGIAPLPGSIALLMALIAGEDPPLSPDPFDPLRFGRPG